MTALELGIDAILAAAIIIYLSGILKDAKRRKRAERMAQKTMEAINANK